MNSTRSLILACVVTSMTACFVAPPTEPIDPEEGNGYTASDGVSSHPPPIGGRSGDDEPPAEPDGGISGSFASGGDGDGDGDCPVTSQAPRGFVEAEPDWDGACTLAAGACEFTGAYGIEISVPISYGGNGVVQAGTGTLTMVLRANLQTNDTAVTGNYDVCGFRVPWFDEDECSGGQEWGFDWNESSLPASISSSPIAGRTCGSLGDQQLQFDPFAVIIGAGLTDRLGPLPEDLPLRASDHDSDGDPGYTVLGEYDAGTAPIPLDADQSQTTSEVFYVSRVGGRSEYATTSCVDSIGTMNVTHLDFVAIGCNVNRGVACNTAQTAYLNDAFLNFETTGPAATRIMQLSAGQSCTQVRQAF